MRQAWLAVFISNTHTAFVFCADLESLKQLYQAVNPIFPQPSTQADKQKYNTFDGGCTKPSADQMFSNSTRCGLHTIFSFQLPISNT